MEERITEERQNQFSSLVVRYYSNLKFQVQVGICCVNNPAYGLVKIKKGKINKGVFEVDKSNMPTLTGMAGVVYERYN